MRPVFLILVILASVACRKRADAPAAPAPSVTEPAAAAAAAAPEPAPAPAKIAEVPSGPRSIVEALDRIRSEQKLPALAAAAFSSDGLLTSGAVGFRKRDSGGSVSPDDLWPLGAGARAFTATLAALLVQSGKLRWETTIAEAFPKEAARIDPGYRGVTLEALLRDRGGAPADLPPEVSSALGASGKLTARRRAAVLVMLRQPPSTPPNQDFVASSAGYLMAAAILESAAGKPWEDLVRARIFEPLGMASCIFESPTADRPWGHSGKTAVDPRASHAQAAALNPASGGDCSLQDLGKFLVANLRAARGLPTPLQLDASSIEHLQKPMAGTDHAAAWSSSPTAFGNQGLLTLNGQSRGYYLLGNIIPGRDRAYLAATNTDDPTARSALNLALASMRKMRKGGL